MSTSRDVVLARIRSCLDPGRSGTAVADLPPAPATPGPVPDLPGLLDLLTERLLDYHAQVIRTDADGLAAVLAGLLGSDRPVMPAGLPAAWGVDGTVDGPGTSAADLDAMPCVVTACAVAVAVTGTIVLDHGPDQGRRALSLVPDRHLCVVRADQVVHDVQDAIAVLGAERPLTFISGPSATSDIELQRVEGVHGPRTLQVVLQV